MIDDYLFCTECQNIYYTVSHGLQCPNCYPKNDVALVKALKEFIKEMDKILEERKK